MFQTFTGLEYLKIDIANNFGLDKLDWDARISWFDTNEANLSNLLDEAKEPALFYAGIKAYYDAVMGRPIGYMISLDATSSGLQLLACLTGDRLASQLCNVVFDGQRRNAYGEIYGEMCHRIGDTAKVSLDMAKQAVMTSLYGSKAVPKQVFGEGALLTVFYETMQDLAPAAWELNEAFLTMWDSTALEHSWTLPDNFHVHVKVMSQVKEAVHFLNEPFDVFYNVNMPTESGRSLGANTIHSIDGMIVREMTRRCSYDPIRIDKVKAMLAQPKLFANKAMSQDDKMVVTLWHHYQNTGYLSARILDHLELDNLGHVHMPDILELIDSLPEKPFKVVSIHDCFRCLPHYANDLRQQYNYQLELIARSWMLQALVSEIIGGPVRIGKMDPDLHLDIPLTNYALS